MLNLHIKFTNSNSLQLLCNRLALRWNTAFIAVFMPNSGMLYTTKHKCLEYFSKTNTNKVSCQALIEYPSPSLQTLNLYLHPSKLNWSMLIWNSNLNINSFVPTCWNLWYCKTFRCFFLMLFTMFWSWFAFKMRIRIQAMKLRKIITWWPVKSSYYQCCGNITLILIRIGIWLFTFIQIWIWIILVSLIKIQILVISASQNRSCPILDQ